MGLTVWPASIQKRTAKRTLLTEALTSVVRVCVGVVVCVCGLIVTTPLPLLPFPSVDHSACLSVCCRLCTAPIYEGLRGRRVDEAAVDLPKTPTSYELHSQFVHNRNGQWIWQICQVSERVKSVRSGANVAYAQFDKQCVFDAIKLNVCV